MMRSCFTLINYHGYSMSDLEAMTPIELEVNEAIVFEHLDQLKKLKDSGG